MIIAFGDLQKVLSKEEGFSRTVGFSRVTGAILEAVFVMVSVWLYGVDNTFFSFGMGLMACAAVFIIMVRCREIKRLNWFARYTMPIFLMHTLFAAPCRVLLLKMGIHSAVIQVGAGIIISFVGPITAMIVMEKIKLDFLVYPEKLTKKLLKKG